jgi:hypothetical protein
MARTDVTSMPFSGIWGQPITTPCTAGSVEAPEDRELIPVAIRLIWDVDGVIDVSSRHGEQAGDASQNLGLKSPRPQTMGRG